ncbi:MAG TPA: alpha/beta hydrolase [Burkholderiales bacterium]|nr:alpha/beta hydrolase [Burkholderiales bacterium]
MNIEATQTLVLLPGLDGTEIFFGPLLAQLPPWIDPVVVTYPAGGPNGYDDLIPVVLEAVDGLEEFAILGWSFGGPLALMVAARRRAQVTGVLLCSTFVTSPRPALAPFRVAFIAPVIGAMRALRRLRFLVPGWATTELRKAKGKTWRRVNSRVLARRARAALGIDARQLLVECRSPLMYLVSTRDEVIGRNKLDEVLALAPHTQVAQIEGPHLALFTNPVQSATRIAGFLQRR